MAGSVAAVASRELAKMGTHKNGGPILFATGGLAPAQLINVAHEGHKVWRQGCGGPSGDVSSARQGWVGM